MGWSTGQGHPHRQELVLKLIHPDLVAGEDAVKRLMAEGLTARHIRHPKIVAVYNVSLQQ